MKDVSRELQVVSRFLEHYLTSLKLASVAYGRDLLKRAGEAFVQNGDEERKVCEACVTELLQFSRALEPITAENPHLLQNPDYVRDYFASVAALKRVAATVRLHFLMLDLEALVKDQ